MRSVCLAWLAKDNGRRWLGNGRPNAAATYACIVWQQVSKKIVQVEILLKLCVITNECGPVASLVTVASSGRPTGDWILRDCPLHTGCDESRPPH